MKIDDSKTNRATLKKYFVRNAIPTEEQFAQLIDSGLNQKDDGLMKAVGDPLSIQAVGDEKSFKKLLNFYSSFDDRNPAWTVSLRPRPKPNDPGGLSINDSNGKSRLSIDSASGNVGMGIEAPIEKLEVDGRVKAGGLIVGPGPTGANTVVSDQGVGIGLPSEDRLKAMLDVRGTVNCHGAIAAANIFNSKSFRIGAGIAPDPAKTTPDLWGQLNNNSISINVDTTSAGFAAPPIYITSITSGTLVAGYSSVVSASATAFTVVLFRPDVALSAQEANNNKWRINWIGIEL